MKPIFRLLGLALVAFLFAELLFATSAHQNRNRSHTNSSARFRLLINEGWKYAGEDVPGAESAMFEDSGWKSVDLPHTWNAGDTQDDEPGYRRGIGWYRRRINLTANLRAKRIFIYFDGANQVTQLFVNGRHAGRHEGGYAAFDFDVTDLVRFDEQNVIAVKVDNSHNKDIPPLLADFDFYGGIYRNVWLIATEPVHINLLDHASPGVRIDSPAVSAETATIRTRGTLTNNDPATRSVRLVTTLLDAQDKRITKMESSILVPAGQDASFQQLSEPILRPELWFPDHPYLYTVRVSVYEDRRLLDEIETRMGFRWFRVDPQAGFFLNGKPIKLRGTNRHQDYEGLGNAVPDSLQIQDMKIIKEMGANFVRLAHYPQAPVVLETADRLGLILWEEIPIVDYITVSDSFTRTCENMLVEMIRQHYNHPSVLMWGYMNEILIRLQKGQDYVEHVVGLARRLDQLARQEDGTRLTVMALHPIELYNTSGLADVPQAIGWNLYFGWYQGEFPDFGRFLDDQHSRFPNRPIFISEYGADADRRLHSLHPRRFDYTIEWQLLLHKSYLSQIEERPFLAGTALWNEFDFGSETRGESRPHVNQKGMLTFDRLRKDIYFLYKARLSTSPVLHIAAQDWPKRTGAGQTTGGERKVLMPVEVFSNLPRVELFVNRLSLGARTIQAPGAADNSFCASWDVPFSDGLNTIEARGSNSSGSRTLVDRVDVQFIYRAPVLNDPSFAFRELAVTVGSNAQYKDEAGIVWEADQEYMPGSWGHNGGKVVKTGRNITGTKDDRLYQIGLEGLRAYRFDVPSGDYDVDLLFAESQFSEPGKRVFDVKINGRPVIEKLDLVRDYGAGSAVRRTFKVSVTKDEGLEIDFSSVVGSPLVNAIRVHRN